MKQANVCKEMARDTNGFSGADTVRMSCTTIVRCLNEDSNDVIGGGSCGSEKGPLALMTIY